MRSFLHRATVGALCLSLATSGCLSTSYRLRADELARLAQTPPEERWRSVRATQRMLDSDHPPSNASPLSVGTPVLVMPDVYWYGGRSWSVPSGWRTNPGAAAVRSVGSSSGSGSSSSGSSSSGSSSSGRGAAVAVVAVAVAAAAVSVFVLAGTEGARYDGWLGVPPDEMVYLERDDGSVTAVPLWALSPQVVAGAREGTIYEGHDERYLRLARAPLDRVGMTLQSGFVAAMFPRGDDFTAMLGGRAFLGGYPVRVLGVGLSADVLAAVDGGLVAMVGGEAQVMPLLWLGGYLGGGWVTSVAPGRSLGVDGWYLRAGAHLELPITTRFAASLRAGVSRLDFGGHGGPVAMPELSLGLSIY